jgi:hypothetical protein
MLVGRSLYHKISRFAAGIISATYVALLLAACSPAQHRENGLIFTDWYIVKSFGNTGITTAYGKIKNSSASGTTLNAVALDCAEKVELHETIESGGRISMIALVSVPLPAGLTIAFEPGRKHLMISGFRQPAPAQCKAIFRIAGSDISFEIPVRERKG